jgi:hypothetical protein
MTLIAILKVACGAAGGLGFAWVWGSLDKIGLGLIGAPSVESCFLVGVPSLLLGTVALVL